MKRYGKEPFPEIMQDSKPDSDAAKEGKIRTKASVMVLEVVDTFTFPGKLYEPVAKSQLKKMTKLWQQDVRKAAEKAKRDAEAAEAQAKRAEEAKKVTIEEDASLPKATRSKISKLEGLRGQRVTVSAI